MRGRRAALAGVAALLALAACGDDDDEGAADDTAAEVTEAPATSAAAGTTAAPETTATGEGAPAGEGGPPPVNPCAEGENGQLGPTEPPAEGATALEVTAVDYGFQGLDAVTEPGEYALSLTNGGKELHEIVIVRLNDDETRSVQELLQAQEDPSTFSTDIAFGFACPGATSEPIAANMTEPGRYVAVCFIPVGATPETPPSEFETLGPPHAVQGMVAEVTLEG